MSDPEVDPDRPLPRPNSQELFAVIKGEEERLVYGFLYERRDNPPSYDEIREFASDHYGEPHTWADRRARNLRPFFVLKTVSLGRNRYGYQLLGWRKDARIGNRPHQHSQNDLRSSSSRTGGRDVPSAASRLGTTE